MRAVSGISWPLFLWVLAVFGVFFERPHNPFSVPLFREGLTVLALGYFFLMLWRDRQLAGLLWFFFLLPLVLSAYSAARAGIVYGQFLLYGMIEERRLLGIWFLFPLLYHARDYGDLLRMLKVVALLAALLGILHSVGLVPGFVRYEITDWRVGRANFSGVPMMVAVLLALAAIVQRAAGRLDYALLAVGTVFLISVSQTRQLVLALGLAGLWSVIFSPVPAVRKAAFWSLICILVPVFVMIADVSWFARFGQVFDPNALAGSVRAASIETVFAVTEIWGNGALWLQWQGGAHSLYGPHFFLSDIGIFGSYFRFGVLVLPFVALTLGLLIWIAHGSRWAPDGGLGMRLGVIALVVLWPTGAILESRAAVVAILLTLAVLARRERVYA